MTIESELHALMAEHGPLLQAEVIVTWAKDNPESAIFHALEWNDAIAGHQYRLVQARLLLIRVRDQEGIRQFVSLKLDRVKPGGGYRSLSDVKASSTLRDMLLREVFAEFRRMKLKYDELSKELEPVWEVVSDTEHKVIPPQPDTGAVA